jgi:hypothetical protein
MGPLDVKACIVRARSRVGLDEGESRRPANANTDRQKLLSGAAKEVLIKSVVQAITTYPMNCFLLSSTTRKKITSATSNYWWGVLRIVKPSTGGGGRNLHYQNVLVAWGFEMSNISI